MVASFGGVAFADGTSSEREERRIPPRNENELSDSRADGGSGIRPLGAHRHAASRARGDSPGRQREARDFGRAARTTSGRTNWIIAGARRKTPGNRRTPGRPAALAPRSGKSADGR